MLHLLAIKPTFWWLKSHGISPTTPAGRVLSMTDLHTCAQLTHNRVLLHWKETSYCSQNVNWKKCLLTRISILVPWSCLPIFFSWNKLETLLPFFQIFTQTVLCNSVCRPIISWVKSEKTKRQVFFESVPSYLFLLRQFRNRCHSSSDSTVQFNTSGKKW